MTYVRHQKSCTLPLITDCPLESFMFCLFIVSFISWSQKTFVFFLLEPSHDISCLNLHGMSHILHFMCSFSDWEGYGPFWSLLIYFMIRIARWLIIAENIDLVLPLLSQELSGHSNLLLLIPLIASVYLRCRPGTTSNTHTYYYKYSCLWSHCNIEGVDLVLLLLLIPLIVSSY